MSTQPTSYHSEIIPVSTLEKYRWTKPGASVNPDHCIHPSDLKEFLDDYINFKTSVLGARPSKSHIIYNNVEFRSDTSITFLDGYSIKAKSERVNGVRSPFISVSDNFPHLFVDITITRVSDRPGIEYTRDHVPECSICQPRFGRQLRTSCCLHSCVCQHCPQYLPASESVPRQLYYNLFYQVKGELLDTIKSDKFKLDHQNNIDITHLQNTNLQFREPSLREIVRLCYKELRTHLLVTSVRPFTLYGIYIQCRTLTTNTPYFPLGDPCHLSNLLGPQGRLLQGSDTIHLATVKESLLWLRKYLLNGRDCKQELLDQVTQFRQWRGEHHLEPRQVLLERVLEFQQWRQENLSNLQQRPEQEI